MAKENVKPSSSSSSVQSDKMIGYQKARLPLECFVCFGGLLHHGKWFLCLLAILNWDLASCQ